MSDHFSIKPQIGAAFRLVLHSQFFRTPPYPAQTFENQTIVVTGSNVGLGLEAARHFYRLNCAKLILAVRTISNGETAKESIVGSVKHRTDADAIEIWPLDLSNTQSVIAFAERAKKELPRLDVLVENAGVSYDSWSFSEGFELSIQVNVLNTFLLGLLLLPKLKQAKDAGSSPHLVVVTSEAHHFTKFGELSAPDIYERLNDQTACAISDRYAVSKLMEVLLIRELVSRLNDAAAPPVTIDLVNPGLCHSTLDRNSGVVIRLLIHTFRFIMARTTEVGARTLVHAACAGPESHGEHMSDGQNQDVEKWIYEDVGKRAQKKVFDQTMKVLETRSPGIGKTIGL